MKKSFLVLNLLFLLNPVLAQSYDKTIKGQHFIHSMTGKFGYSQSELQQIFSHVQMDNTILNKISRPAEKTTPWYRYKKIFLDKERINHGVAFYQKYKTILDEAYKKFGVPQSIIVAILGVETRYGKVMGNDKVITALSTIAFNYPKREKFFTKELKAFLKMAKSEGFDPLLPKGSYAGAMGMAQFMPSSYLHYAVDYENDGKKDLWNNPADAIFSIANYLAKNGWQRDGLIVDTANLTQPYKGKYSHKPFTTLHNLNQQGIYLKNTVSIGNNRVGLLTLDGQSQKQYYITFPNFAVITTYNTSPMYAMAVTELSKIIEKKH